MSARLATDVEIKTWREEGWILLEGLVGTDEIDAAADDLHLLFPTAAEYHADPTGVTARWKGYLAPPKEDYVWPDEGVGFRAEQHQWNELFPFGGTGVLNRLYVHPSIVDFAERALGNTDIRLYQAQAAAKYSGSTNFEQPMHIDRNHSWLPSGTESPWWNLQGFLYLSDVTAAENPTRLVPLSQSAQVTSPYGVTLPEMDPEVYAAERSAPGVRGSFLAYRSDVYHRGAPFGSSDPSARFTAGIAFKNAGQDWIGYDQQQSRSSGPEWTSFAEGSSPRELELFGFPPPGHAIWDAALVEATAQRYPGLDLDPWRAKLEG